MTAAVLPFPAPAVFTNPVDRNALALADPAALLAVAALLEDDRTHEVVFALVMDIRDESPRHVDDVETGAMLAELARRLRAAVAERVA